MKVTVDDLADRLDEYGTTAFVVTVGADGSPKVVHVPVMWDGSVFRCTPGGGTLANLIGSGSVTLVFPAPEGGGAAFSLTLRAYVAPQTEEEDEKAVTITG